MMKRQRLTEDDLKTMLARRGMKQIHTQPVPNPPKRVIVGPQYRSKLEARFAQQLALEKEAGAIKGWLYEPFSFKLANGARYRVDFVTWGEAGTECIECKGHHKNMRDSLLRLRWAAQRFPFFTWRKVWWTGYGFDGQYIVV